MSFDLCAVSGPEDEQIAQGAWPPIWVWLNDKDQCLPPDKVRAGVFNDGLEVSEATACRFAQIIRAHPGEGPPSLAEDGRRDRLIRFFESCGGFRIR